MTDTKYTSDVRPLLRNAKEIAQKRPNKVITDGAANFHEAFKKAIYHSSITVEKTYFTCSSSG